MSNAIKLPTRELKVEDLVLAKIRGGDANTTYGLFASVSTRPPKQLEHKLGLAKHRGLSLGKRFDTGNIFELENLTTKDVEEHHEIHILVKAAFRGDSKSYAEDLNTALMLSDGKILLQSNLDKRDVSEFEVHKAPASSPLTLAPAQDVSDQEPVEANSQNAPSNSIFPFVLMAIVATCLSIYAYQHPPTLKENLTGSDFTTGAFVSFIFLVIHPVIYPVTGWGVLALAVMGRIFRHFGHFGAYLIGIFGGATVASLALAGGFNLGVFVGSALGIALIEVVLLLALLVVLNSGNQRLDKDAQKAELRARLRELE